jgi:DNA-binding MarR family transcriptional regulator
MRHADVQTSFTAGALRATRRAAGAFRERRLPRRALAGSGTCSSADLSAVGWPECAQAQLLCVIKDRPRGMTELTHILGLERPGISGLVDRVQRRGLVLREGAEHDRRAALLTPTPTGKRVAEEFCRELSGRLRRLVDDLPAADRFQFERIGSKILADECVPAVFGPAKEDPARSRSLRDPSESDLVLIRGDIAEVERTVQRTRP